MELTRQVSTKEGVNIDFRAPLSKERRREVKKAFAAKGEGVEFSVHYLMGCKGK